MGHAITPGNDAGDLQDPAEPYRVDQQIETSGQPVEVETEASGQKVETTVTTTTTEASEGEDSSE